MLQVHEAFEGSLHVLVNNVGTNIRKRSEDFNEQVLGVYNKCLTLLGLQIYVRCVLGPSSESWLLLIVQRFTT